jgi:hypothetical protein
MKWLFILLRWLCIPLLALQLFSGSLQLFQNSQWSKVGFSPIIWVFAGGIIFRWLFSLVWKRYGKDCPLDFVDTLEHELTHALFGYLTFTPPQSLSATLKEGGEVQLARSNLFIALGPYFFPLWTMILFAIGFGLRDNLQWKWSLLLGFFLGSFVYRISKEFRFYQTDLQVYGFLFSSLLTFNLGLLLLGMLLHTRHILDIHWLWQSIPQTSLYFQKIFTWIKDHLF